jgi:DNA polymerase-3 subunit alpha (Gram-positive type)
MDGIASPRELFEKAKKLGHKAIGIADLDSVQSFPEIEKVAKETGVKPIYGSSFNVISKYPEIILNYDDSKANDSIEGQVYIVFDLETTGLSPIHDEIIEFGAVKIVDQRIAGRKQFFVKPTKPLKEFTKELTGITDNMLSKSKNEKESFKEIYEYLSQGIPVAHNAKFDMGFINEKSEKYNYPPLKNMSIDTLSLARFLRPKLKSYRLAKVAFKYYVPYDNEVSHRADYDAGVLASIWVRMVSELTDIAKTLGELNIQSSDNLMNNKFANEVTFFAKNQKGLKELFKLVSKSHTISFHKKPVLYLEDIEHSDNLISSSGSLRSRLVNFMLTGTTKQLLSEINRTDIIEIQPISNYSHLLKRKNITIEQLSKAIKNIITVAKKLGKIVVGTGDVRYANIEKKLLHKVYINSKGLGGARHHLFKYHEIDPDYPSLEYKNTQQMLEEFNFLDDINLIKEIVIVNPAIIADQIEDIKIIRDELFTPKIENADEMLKELVFNNAYKTYGNPLPEIVEKRIHIELDSIIKYGYSVIYWISHKLVSKSIKDGYLVGSRGSVGSSLVATLSDITEVNPLRAHYYCGKCQFSEFPETLNKVGYDLEDKNCPNCNESLIKEGHTIPFETFLGFEANKVPDIDLNFSGEYQPIIHNEVKKIFGESHCFRAGTISTVAERTAFGYAKA